MDNKIIKYLLSFILAIILLISEIFLMIQFNISRGIKKEDINKIIDNINIENEIIETDEYKKLEEQINIEILQEIIESQELNNYIKQNLKALSSNILYNENNTYISSDELTQFVNNVILEKQELFGIHEEEIEIINKELDNLTKEIEQNIEEVELYKNEIKIIYKFLENKTTTYMIAFTLIITAIIILINQSKDKYIFVGMPTLIVGVIFLILWLSLSQKINTTGIDKKIIIYANKYLPNLLKTLKQSSIIITIIGTIGCTLYTILHYQEVQENGKK